jgi:iron-sulfur cluster repair protein YtfE (RIC family)
VTDTETATRIRADHDRIRSIVEQVRAVADGLDSHDADLTTVVELHHTLDTDLLEHERSEEADLLPMMARILGGDDPLASLSRTHAEIAHQVGRLGRLLDDVGVGKPETEDVIEIRRLLYGLYGVLRLHNAQEEEGLFSLLQKT